MDASDLISVLFNNSDSSKVLGYDSRDLGSTSVSATGRLSENKQVMSLLCASVLTTIKLRFAEVAT